MESIYVSGTVLVNEGFEREVEYIFSDITEDVFYLRGDENKLYISGNLYNLNFERALVNVCNKVRSGCIIALNDKDASYHIRYTFDNTKKVWIWETGTVVYANDLDDVGKMTKIRGDLRTDVVAVD